MNSNYDQFFDTIVELHKAMAEEKLECLAHEEVQAEFLYLKAIDLWMKSVTHQTPKVFTSIRAFADELAIKHELSVMPSVISINRARKQIAA